MYVVSWGFSGTMSKESYTIKVDDIERVVVCCECGTTDFWYRQRSQVVRGVCEECGAILQVSKTGRTKKIG